MDGLTGLIERATSTSSAARRGARPAGPGLSPTHAEPTRLIAALTTTPIANPGVVTRFSAGAVGVAGRLVTDVVSVAGHVVARARRPEAAGVVGVAGVVGAVTRVVGRASGAWAEGGPVVTATRRPGTGARGAGRGGRGIFSAIIGAFRRVTLGPPRRRARAVRRGASIRVLRP